MFNILQESTPSNETNKTIECGKDETKRSWKEHQAHLGQ
jgi:hypothetical protein